MTEKEQLKGDLISRDIEDLHAFILANELDALEHIAKITIGPCCIDPKVRYDAGEALRSFVRRVRQVSAMLHRIDTEFKP